MKLPRLPAPFHLAFGLFTASGCTFGEKLAAVRFMRALQEKHFRLANDCTVAELLDRHQQHGVIRHCLWHALCLAALNTAPEKASAQLFANTLRDSIGGSQSDTDLLLPAADLSRIFPDAAADFIKAHRGKIHLSTRIEDIDPVRCKPAFAPIKKKVLSGPCDWPTPASALVWPTTWAWAKRCKPWPFCWRVLPSGPLW